MAKHIYSALRPGFGYEPGDEVTPEFAAARPWAVREVPEQKPPAGKSKSEDAASGGGEIA